MAQSKVSKSNSGVNSTHVYIIIVLLVVIAALLIYTLVVSNGASASGKFH